MKNGFYYNRFIDNKDKQDYRAEFANFILKYVYKDFNGEVTEELKKASEHLHENVRNIYELISDEIPLLFYYDLVRFGRDNFDSLFEDNDTSYEQALADTLKACEVYYKNQE